LYPRLLAFVKKVGDHPSIRLRTSTFESPSASIMGALPYPQIDTPTRQPARGQEFSVRQTAAQTYNAFGGLLRHDDQAAHHSRPTFPAAPRPSWPTWGGLSAVQKPPDVEMNPIAENPAHEGWSTQPRRTAYEERASSRLHNKLARQDPFERESPPHVATHSRDENSQPPPV
jgi:hypothetical protein